ncbi:SH3 domain-containing YSC84-like protein 1 isoform X3 [Alosa alosa]|uniref:SH3 domain-containing YSC84-like protein 1 isoform X3 n=1 Tax=Alosa alosa TaxID=278164 RepID=UPI0020151ACB|nr:SH3 domain-containing YSC84-like protein 1 isoform X3 [Alosa alosa]
MLKRYITRRYGEIDGTRITLRIAERSRGISYFVVNNPIPSNLKSEAKKAAKILREFTVISNRTGPDKLIPAHIIATAQGLAIISVIRAGFMITARGGSGIVIARLPDGRWSAPSAIGIAGLGGGFEIGLEASDFVIILYQKRAVEAFSKGGNLTFGGNCTVAVGPLGRNLEADVALRSTAAVFSYCKSRGLYAGVSLEGSYLVERKETNRKFYGRDIRASAILNGDVDPPSDVFDLYTILDDYVEKYTNDWQSRHARLPSSRASNIVDFLYCSPYGLTDEWASSETSASQSEAVSQLRSELQWPGRRFKACHLPQPIRSEERQCTRSCIEWNLGRHSHACL